MSFLNKFPDREALLKAYSDVDFGFPLKINNHIHTPYSFSAFTSMAEAVGMAAGEEVRILGINDFYVTDGYGEFTDMCLDHRVFPLLNIELIGISRKEQDAGIRVNDPNNPGRIYISGKGLAFPAVLTAVQQNKLDRVVEESNRQVSDMIDLLNIWMKKQGVGLSISVAEIMEKQAMSLLRERHVAKMLRLKLSERAENSQEYDEMIRKLYGGERPAKEEHDKAGTEEELRTRLLKSGAPAFVPEDEKAFLPLEEIVEIIRDAGGIPTYPVLMDGAAGRITEFENDKVHLLSQLKERGFQSVEFIPLRNRFEKLKEYAEYFYDNGFVVSFGTEHNTTAMLPLTVSCKEEIPLDDRLMEISFNGAAYVAAHQYRFAREGRGHKAWNRRDMELLGKAVLQYYIKTK